MDLKTMLGQRLVLGFNGTAISDAFRQLVREYKVGNVILFRRNVVNCDQLRTLCADLQELILEETGYPAFITIDQEGGMVVRLSEDAVNVPGAMALAATGDVENAYRAALITAKQLRGVGVNFNLAPVLDVNCNPQNPVIGVRSFGDDPEKVAALGAAAVRGYRDGGVLSCGKHFPGHGDTTVDSHLGLPCIDKSLDELRRVELVPFKAAIEAGIPAMMSSHILFPQIEQQRIPATMSRCIMTGLLRDEMGFDGLILSDCMMMNAIRTEYGTENGVVAAMQAGVDLVFVSNTDDGVQERSVAHLLKEAERGALDHEEMECSVNRILKAKEAFAFTGAEPALLGNDEDRAAAQTMIRQAVTYVSGPRFTADENTFFCGCGDYRSSNVANPESDEAPFPMVMGRRFNAPNLLTLTRPDDDMIRRALAGAAACRNIVMCTCNAHLYREQLELAKALSELGKPMMVVTLRNPYDLPLLPDNVGKLAAWDYSAASMRAIDEVLRGGMCTGVLPIRLEVQA